jgi:SAM-dependent methyltransferase
MQLQPVQQTTPTAVPPALDATGPLRLFYKSVLKQRKYREIIAQLGSTAGLQCLDIGGDNGVISYLLRQRGGSWKSVDLDEPSVFAIRRLVQSDVYQIDGERTPFQTDAFDCVVIIDFLEHIPNDRVFITELHRVIRPSGLLIVNVPHRKHSLLRRLRLAIGQTDEKHGHLRPGYTVETLQQVLGDEFIIEEHRTYSKFFSEVIDTLIVQCVYLLQGDKKSRSKKGALVTGDDLKTHQAMFRVYSLIYPVVWLFSTLDALLFFRSGYMLIAKARVNPKHG